MFGKCRCRSRLLLILATAFIIQQSFSRGGDALESTSSSAVEDEDEIDLNSLTDTQLEEFCTDRGFVLVRDKSASAKEIEYSHDDYVDAARQCLAIEAEM